MDYDRLYEALYEEVRQRFADCGGCHDFDHTVRVIRNAMLLCRAMPKADCRIVQLAALLHDIARTQEDESKGATDHAVQGAEMVREMLSTSGLSQEQIHAVAEAVRTHRYRGNDRPATLEAAIVYDADKLDSLGAVGLGRAFLFAGKAGARLHNQAQEALASEPYSREDTAYREYLVKLRKLPDAMLTRPARRIALKRAEFMKRFFKVLDQETDYRKEEKMKLECPHCWQHYEIAKGDLNREFTCLNCEQTFRAQDAVILDRGKKYSPWLLGGMGAIIILLLLLNFWSWQRMSGPRKPDPQNAPIAAQVVQSVTPQPDLQTVMAPLYRTLKEFRSENEKMQKQITLLTQARQDLAERLEKAEKQLASNNGNARFEAQEESINTLKIKINSANAQIKLLDEYHKQLLKGLTELRQDLQVLNLNERITTLEKKADNIDLTPINRRIDRLDALVNAIRTVDR